LVAAAGRAMLFVVRKPKHAEGMYRCGLRPHLILNHEGHEEHEERSTEGYRTGCENLVTLSGNLFQLFTVSSTDNSGFAALEFGHF